MCDRSQLAEKRASEKRVEEAVSRTLARLRELYPSEEALRAHMQKHMGQSERRSGAHCEALSF